MADKTNLPAKMNVVFCVLRVNVVKHGLTNWSKTTNNMTGVIHMYSNYNASVYFRIIDPSKSKPGFVSN